MGEITPGSVQDCGGRLTINGTLLATHAYLCPDLTELWVPTPSSYRGRNVVIPGAVGQLATPRRLDEANVSLPLVISGVTDTVGNRYSDHWIGLETNVVALHAAIDQPAPPSTTVAASLLLPSGAVRTASVQVNGIQVGEHVGPVFRCVLELTIPAGRFA